eukprot:UN27096
MIFPKMYTVRRGVFVTKRGLIFWNLLLSNLDFSWFSQHKNFLSSMTNIFELLFHQLQKVNIKNILCLVTKYLCESQFMYRILRKDLKNIHIIIIVLKYKVSNPIT